MEKIIAIFTSTVDQSTKGHNYKEAIAYKGLADDTKDYVVLAALTTAKAEIPNFQNPLRTSINLVVEGVDLAALLHKKFCIGTVTFEGWRYFKKKKRLFARILTSGMVTKGEICLKVL